MSQLGKDYPHDPDQIMLKCLMFKLKAICLKYRQAVFQAKGAVTAGLYCVTLISATGFGVGHQQHTKFYLASRFESTDMAGEPSGVMPDVAGIAPEGPNKTEDDTTQNTQSSEDREEDEIDTPTGQQSDTHDLQMPSSQDQDSSSQR